MWRWCLNSKQAVLQLIAEGSRRCEMLQGNFQHLTHTWMVKMVQKPWYITWKGTQKKGGEKKKKKKGRRNTTVKRKNSKLLITLLRHDRGCFSALLHVQLLPLNTNNRYLFSRFKLAFSPTFYKFIVRACWAWVHSYFGVRAKTSPYISFYYFGFVFFLDSIFITQ